MPARANATHRAIRGGAGAGADRSVTAADRWRGGFSRWAWGCRGGKGKQKAKILWGKTSPPLCSMTGLSSSCPHLHRSQFDGCHRLRHRKICAAVRSPPARFACFTTSISRFSRCEFSTRGTQDPTQLDTTRPHPFVRLVSARPVCDNPRNRSEEKRSTQFAARNRKNRANIGLLVKARQGGAADDSHKTLTQRADYSWMTGKTRPKMSSTKQRTK